MPNVIKVLYVGWSENTMLMKFEEIAWKIQSTLLPRKHSLCTSWIVGPSSKKSIQWHSGTDFPEVFARDDNWITQTVDKTFFGTPKQTEIDDVTLLWVLIVVCQSMQNKLNNFVDFLIIRECSWHNYVAVQVYHITDSDNNSHVWQVNIGFIDFGIKIVRRAPKPS